jgi:hypothetical protein
MYVISRISVLELTKNLEWRTDGSNQLANSQLGQFIGLSVNFKV